MTSGSGQPAAAGIRVAVLAFAGVDDLDLTGGYAVLSKAASIAVAGQADVPGWDVRICAEPARFATAGGLDLTAQAGLDFAAAADALVIPGGRGIDRLLSQASYLDCVRAAWAGGAALYCVCSGVLLAAASGVLTGRRLAIHAGKQAQLAALTECSIGSGLIRDGRVTTVGGQQQSSAKSLDLALQLVADRSPALLAAVSARMELVAGQQLQIVEPASGRRA